MKIKYCPFLVLIAFLSFSSNLLAVGAYPFPIEKEQPNGEKITIRLYGNEDFHYATTNDNYVIAQDENGYYTFAQISEDGNIKPGNVKVSASLLKIDYTNFILADSPEFIEKVVNPANAKQIEINSLKSTTNTTAATEKKGERRALIILVNFSDVKFASENTREKFDQMYNQEGYNTNGAIGSARDYFIDNSRGQFKPQFDLFGPVELTRNSAYYGQNNVYTWQLLTDACNSAKAVYEDLDFNNYVNDNAGVVDNIFILYAGYSEAETNNTNDIWPLQGTIPYNLTIDGVKISSYACTAELRGKTGTNMSGIGTFIHEYSHSLGLPDLYDTDGSTNGLGIGVGAWSIMHSGNYLNDGKTPPYFNSMERNMLGWLEPTVLTANEVTQHLTLESISSNVAYRINTPTNNEYFLIENRKIEKWDSYLLYNYVGNKNNSGMLIYHVDKSNNYITYWNNKKPNIIGNHQCFSFVFSAPLPSTISANDYWGYVEAYRGTPYPGISYITSISDNTNPHNLKSWVGENSDVIIENIDNNTILGLVSFDFKSSNPSAIKTIGKNVLFAYFDGRSINFENITETTKVEMSDINGQIILKQTIAGNISFPVENKGIYIIKLQTDQQTYTYKAINQ